MASTATQRAVQILPRGVHEAEYLIGGHRVLLAINRTGDCVKRVKIREDDQAEVARLWLEGFLERVDPQPALVLIRPTPPEPPPRLSPALFARIVARRGA